MKGPASNLPPSPSLGRKILKLDPIDHPAKMAKYEARIKNTVKVYTNNSFKVTKEPLFVSPLRGRKLDSLGRTKETLQKMMLIPALSRNYKYFESKRFSV